MKRRTAFGSAWADGSLARDPWHQPRPLHQPQSTGVDVMARFRLGCNTVLFAMVGVEEALQHLAGAGYDAAELPYIASMAEHVQPGTALAQRIRGLAGDLGLDLCAIEVTPNDPARVE